MIMTWTGIDGGSRQDADAGERRDGGNPTTRGARHAGGGDQNEQPAAAMPPACIGRTAKGRCDQIV